MYETIPTRFNQSFGIKLGDLSAGEPPGCLVRIYPADGIGQMVELAHEQTVLGRDAGCDLELADDSVSRRHAAIEFAGGGFDVVDLGSTNGTYVNDVRVARQRLNAGDRLRVGNQIFRFLGADRIEAEYFETVYRIMTVDGLTQVYNKRCLLESLERELLRAQRTLRSLSVLLFDVDRFKTINDTHGHLAGDEVLVELCRRAKGLLRRDELLARYGGEEFALVLVETPLDEARLVAERLRQTIAENPFTTERAEIGVTISIGVAETRDGESIAAAELLDRADKQLYAAKEAGRNRVCG